MNLANRITILRILLVPLFIGLVVYSKLNMALIVFTFAVITDALDGYVARVMNQRTKLGAMLDPLADKALLVSAFISLSFAKALPEHVKFPLYVLIIVISRDTIILLGIALIYILGKEVKIKSKVLGKITTFFQMLTIICVLTEMKYSNIVWNAMIAFTIASGLQYIMIGSKALNERA